MNKFTPWCATILLLFFTATSARADDRNDTVIHDSHGNFDGQIITKPDGEQKYYDCHGQLAGWITSTGSTYNKDGQPVGSIFELSKRINECRGKAEGR